MTRWLEVVVFHSVQRFRLGLVQLRLTLKSKYVKMKNEELYFRDVEFGFRKMIKIKGD